MSRRVDPALTRAAQIAWTPNVSAIGHWPTNYWRRHGFWRRQIGHLRPSNPYIAALKSVPCIATSGPFVCEPGTSAWQLAFIRTPHQELPRHVAAECTVEAMASQARAPLAQPVRAHQRRATGAVRSSTRLQALPPSPNASTQSSSTSQPSRRALLSAVGAIALSGAIAEPSHAAKLKGFNVVKDTGDKYLFAYPFGWQEVTVDGADVVYKDIIEPLESVSVTLVPTDKKTLNEFGTAEEVAETLATRVLTSPNQEVKVLRTQTVAKEGKTYYQFEFTSKASNYTRHALASVTVADGKFYTLVTGANEKRWNKMKDKLQTVVDSFQLIYGAQLYS